MGAGRAVVLNLEAELELAAGRAVTPPRAMAERLVALRARAARAFLGPGDVLVEPGVAPPASARGLVGLAWCPTPSALRLLERAGAVPAPAPTLEVLSRVNARAFCAGLGPGLPGARLVRSAEEAAAHLAERPPAEAWLAKRAFTFAARGQRRLTGGPLAAPDRAWFEAALDGGAVQLEPRVELVLEFVVHGRVSTGGVVRTGPVCVLEADAAGAWQRTRPVVAGELLPGEEAALALAAREAGEALRAAGYHGAYGVDGFRWRDAAGSLQLQPRSELNARWTFGWRVGFPDPADLDPRRD